MLEIRPTVSVLLCAYTEARWNDLVEAVQSVQRQVRSSDEIIVIVDHNDALLRRVRSEIQGVRSIENCEARGLSGARNSGLAIAKGEIVAFMDEDAIAAPDWLERLLQHYAKPTVLGVGGAIEPLWQTGRPSWFPHEFDWVVGCTYWGMPLQLAPVRNLIGCNMSIRRALFLEIGGFRNGIGRVGTLPVGCEETELCIRARQHWPHAEFLYDPDAHVLHRVPARRATWRYFFRRCFAEGRSKALIARYVGTEDALSSERSYTYRTLPAAVLNGIADLLRGHVTGVVRATAIITGFTTTVIGYMSGRLNLFADKKRDFAQVTEQITEPPLPGFKAALVGEVELSQPLPHFSAVAESGGYQRHLLLIRLHDQPLGLLDLKIAAEGMSADELALSIWRAYADSIQTHLRADGLSTTERLGAEGIPDERRRDCSIEKAVTNSALPPVTVVIATRNRAASLSRTLDSLLAMDYPDFEILVVDNNPSNDETARMLRERYGGNPAIRYIREDEPGLAIAHNRGLGELHTPIVAFTDDDVKVDRHWLRRMVAGFSVTENVGCVTGMILPAELQTPAQQWIEEYGGFSKGFEQRIFDLKTHRPATPLHPYSAGIFGSGASMAFRSEALRAIGGFDPALGAGSKALGGDDLAAFFEIINHGYRIVYEPAAILYHFHRRDYAGLRRQAYGYGVGLTAYLTRTLWDRPSRIGDFLLRVPSGLAHVFNATSTKNARKQADYPAELTRLERRGMMVGPFAYLASRWQMRRHGSWRLPDNRRQLDTACPAQPTLAQSD